MLTIGEFSRICFVTKKTLRHYDEIGILRPEHTAENGYRYYTAGQLRTMLLISRLKRYGLSLPEIAAVLANPDEELLAQRLLEKRRRMEEQVEDARRVLQEMERDIDKLKRRMDIMDQNIAIKTVTLDPFMVYGVRRKMKVDNQSFSSLIGQLFAEVARKQLHPAGPPLAFYHDEEFSSEHSDIEAAVQVAEEVEGLRQVPGGLHCCTTLVGPYRPEAFTAAYAGLCQWIEENGYRIGGAPFDKYVRGGEDVSPEEYITEIYFPITK